MTACMVPTCTEKATHHLTGPEIATIDACDAHFKAMRPLMPLAGEDATPSERVLCDIVETTVYMRADLDNWQAPGAFSTEALALHILRQLTAPHSNTLELLRRYIDERHAA